MEKMLLKTTRDLLRRMAGSQPIALVFEDVHWADPSSVRLLEQLFILAREEPILLILLCRPGFPDSTDALLAALGLDYTDLHVRLSLDPMDDRSARTFLDNLLGTSGPAALLLRRLRAHAPLFLADLV